MSLTEVPTHSDLLASAAKRSHDWLHGKAFPFWAEQCWSPEGAFFETLTLDGNGLIGRESRVRVQARQVFSFALAGQLGWEPKLARHLVERGLEVLATQCRREDGLYGAKIRLGEGLSDSAVQLYDNAFALLAFATAYEAFELPQAFELGTQLNASFEQNMSRPSGEKGYKEYLTAPKRREQNPHMHLCEASLAWFAATREQAALDRATGLVNFVEERFFDRDKGLLLEFAGEDIASNHIEAGHMFEWTWILGRMAQLSNSSPLPWQKALYDGANRAVQGYPYIPLSQHTDGTALDGRQRTWILTEALKAHVAMERHHPSDHSIQSISECLDKMFVDHRLDELDGGWLDALDHEGEPATDQMTAATGYHVFLALAEVIDLAQQRSL